MPMAPFLQGGRRPSAGLARTGVLLLTALAIGPTAVPLSAQPSQLGVQPGDEIEIRIFTQSGEPLPALLGPRYVDLEGQLYLPFVGSVEVRGLDTAGIRTALERRFSSFYDNPVVDVAARYKVNVTGAVRSPGHYFVVPGATIQDALAVAGGALSELDGASGYGGADASQVRLVRGDEVRILDMRADAAADATTREVVASGDWLFVPTRPRARFRDNLQLVSSVLTVVGSVAVLISLFAN